MDYLHYLRETTIALFQNHLQVVGRTNIFQMDTPTVGPPFACKPYPFLLKYQKFVNNEIRLLENAGCISKSLSPWAPPVFIVPRKPDPLKP